MYRVNISVKESGELRQFRVLQSERFAKLRPLSPLPTRICLIHCVLPTLPCTRRLILDECGVHDSCIIMSEVSLARMPYKEKRGNGNQAL
jgi:hypothetical protein